VVLAIPSSLAFIESAYGALYAGTTMVPAAVGPTFTSEALARVVQSSGARLIVSEESVIEGLGGRQAVIDATDGVAVATLAELLEAGDADSWIEPDIDGDTVAALLFTSGSTGNPKGVMLTHASTLGSCRDVVEAIGMTEESTFAGWAPFHHAMGLVAQLLLPVYTRASLVMTPTAQFQRRPVFWLQLISKHRATISVAGNFAFELCAQLVTEEQLEELDLSSLESLLSGSEPVRLETVRRFVDRFAPAGVTESMIAPAMAMTETMMMSIKRPGTELRSIQVDAAALEAGELVEASDGRATSMVSCGQIAPLSNVVIVDPADETILPEGRVGEIWAAGPGVAAGYLENPEATAEVFGGRLPGDDRVYVRSGDLGALIDGELYVTGRIKDLIIVRGRNIYPQDLEEAALRSHRAVGISAAFELHEDHAFDVGIVAEVDLEEFDSKDEDFEALVDEVRTALTRQFSLPSLAVAFVAVGSVPRTPTGKVKRSMARQQIEAGGMDVLHLDGFARPAKAVDPA